MNKIYASVDGCNSSTVASKSLDFVSLIKLILAQSKLQGYAKKKWLKGK